MSMKHFRLKSVSVYFDPKKYILKSKLTFFSLLCYCKNSNFVLILPIKTCKKTLSKVGYFSFFNVSYTRYKSLLPVALELSDFFQPGHHKRKWTNKNENENYVEVPHNHAVICKWKSAIKTWPQQVEEISRQSPAIMLKSVHFQEDSCVILISFKVVVIF